MEKTINKKNKYSFARLLSSEIKSEFTVGKLLGATVGMIVVPVLISYLGLMIGGFGSFDNTALLLLSATGAVSIFMISRIVSTARSKATIDKNKAAFLYYGKNKVTAAKLLVEAMFFSLGFFMLFAIAQTIAGAENSNVDYGRFNADMFMIYPGYLMLYLFIFTLVKWIISFIPKKGFAFAAAMLIAIGLLIPVWILNQIPSTTTLAWALNQGAKNKSGLDPSTSWFSTHQLATSFIPIMNTGLIGGAGVDIHIDIPATTGTNPTPVSHLVFSQLSGNDWYIVMPILYSGIFIAAIWNFQSSAQKRFLAAS